MYPNAVITLLHKRPSDPDAYPVSPGYVTIEDGMVCWLVQSGDLAEEGRGQCEIIFVQNNVVAKDIIRETQILPALDGSGAPPDPWESWQTDIARIAGEIAQDRSATEQAADDAVEAQRDAEAAQEAAESAARDATGSAGNAASSARAAEQSVTDAGLAQDGAEEAQRQAEAAQGKAEDAQSGAEEAQGKAETAKQEAKEAAEAAATSERNAAGSVTDAAAQVELAKKYVDGKGTDGTVDPAFSENNANYYLTLTRQAKRDAEDTVNGAKQEIDDEGAAQVQAVEDKGAEVLESIPADYSAMTEEVAAAAQDATAQELLAILLQETQLTETMLISIGATFDALPQDETATDIMYSLKLEADRLQLVYENWLEEREGA